MSEHKVALKWARGDAEFSYQKYPRDHTWSFDGGYTVIATAAPAYLGNPAPVDPEEAFVASLSSCHMLTFLAIACKQKFVIDSYEDEAVGHLEKNTEGKLAITRVELRPRIQWGGDRKPSAEELDKMHHASMKIVSLPTRLEPWCRNSKWLLMGATEDRVAGLKERNFCLHLCSSVEECSLR